MGPVANMSPGQRIALPDDRELLLQHAGVLRISTNMFSVPMRRVRRHFLV